MFTLFFGVMIAGQMIVSNGPFETEELCKQAEKNFSEYFATLNPVTLVPRGEHLWTRCERSGS